MRGDVANDETLAWEARQRPRAAIAASAAAVLIIASYVISGAVFADVPRRASSTPSIARRSPDRQRSAESHHAAVSVLFGQRRSGDRLLGGPRDRVPAHRPRAHLPGARDAVADPAVPKLALYVPIVGAVLSAISYLVSPIGTLLAVQKYLDGPRTVEAAQDVSTSSLVTTAALIGFVGQLAIALAFVLICLNAMRVGLLTRFMGVLGILSGVLTLIPVGRPAAVVQCFWLGALAVLFLGRWPKGDPPAWRTGNAEPWPTQQQLREARRGGNAEAGGEGRSRERESGSVAAVAASSGSVKDSIPPRRRRSASAADERGDLSRLPQAVRGYTLRGWSEQRLREEIWLRSPSIGRRSNGRLSSRSS
jgi:hypothetical protein